MRYASIPDQCRFSAGGGSDMEKVVHDLGYKRQHVRLQAERYRERAVATLGDALLHDFLSGLRARSTT
jgi:hypothetical protein